MVRLKHRYMLVKLEFIGERITTITEKDIYRTVVNSVQKFHGDYGLASVQSSLSVKYANSKTGVIIIRARRGVHSLVLQSLALWQHTGNAFFRTLHVGGSIRSCQKFLGRHYRQELVAQAAHCTSEKELDSIRAALWESSSNASALYV